MGLYTLTTLGGIKLMLDLVKRSFKVGIALGMGVSTWGMNIDFLGCGDF